MKKILYSILFITTALLFNNCTDEDKPIFIADLSSEEIAFKNSFADEYLLSKETKENIADRFIWNETTLGTNNDYELQGAINSSFTTHTVIGKTNATNYIVLVKQLLDFAEQLELDNDPTTTGSDGAVNNKGTVYFRIKASIGNGGAGTEEIFSEIQSINIVWIEQKTITDEACTSVWAVGDAITDVGWDFTNAVEFTCKNNVYSARLKLQNDGSNLLTINNFGLFTTRGDWDTGTLGYKYYSDANYTIDANFRSAEDDDGNFNFTGTNGTYNMVIDENTKTITLDKSPSYLLVGDAVPNGWSFTNVTVAVELTPYIRTATLTFTAGSFRFFTVSEDWTSGLNFPYFKDLEYTIDAKFENDGSDDANFKFIGTPGEYTITINELEKTITLE